MTPLKIEFVGKVAHAGISPEKGINALNAMIKVFTGIDSLRQHVTSDVRIHGIITRGGDAPNIVPAYTSALLFVRAADYRYMAEVVERVEDIVKGAELMTGAKAKFSIEGNIYKDISPNIANWKVLRRKYFGSWLDSRPSTTAIDTFSTDLGNVSHTVPTDWAMFAVSRSEIAHHSQEYAEASSGQLAMENMLLTAKGMALTGLDLLEERNYVLKPKRNLLRPKVWADRERNASEFS